MPDLVMAAAQTVVGLALLLAAWWPIRARIARRTEQAFERRYPRNADGIIVGAEPIVLPGSRPGRCVLLHGYNDSPQSMGELAHVLNARGWSVHVPLLPGHGRTLQAFARSRAIDWITAARAACQDALATHEPVAVAGLSMGGAIAFLVAAEFHAVRAVVGIAPYLGTPRALDLTLPFAGLAGLGSRYLVGTRRPSILDRAAADAIIAYRASTPQLLRELAAVAHRAATVLPQVQQPVLVQQSLTDPRIAVTTAQEAFARIGATSKQLDWVSGAGHVLTMDYGHRERAQHIASWLEPHLA